MSGHDDLETFDGADLLNSLITENDLSGFLFQGVQFDHSEVIGISEQSSFINCKFEAATFNGGGLRNCYFERSDLSNIETNDSNFSESHLTLCNITDARFIETSMFGIVLSDCILTKTEFLDCDLSYSIFNDCSLRGVRLDDSDLSGADLSTCYGLTTEQLEAAIGNSETRLPPGVDRPDSWYTVIPPEEKSENIPHQRLAPLRVMWRHSRIVRDPRGGGEDILRDNSVFMVLRSARDEVQRVLAIPGTNHPVVDRMKTISRMLAGGIHGLNPISLGLQVEVLEASLEVYMTELTEERLASVVSAHKLLLLLVNQFPAWRQLKLNSAIIEPSSASEISKALKRLAVALEKGEPLFDRSVSDSIVAQANDVEASTTDMTAKGAIDSSSNIFARLLSSLSTKSKRVGDVALEESTKVLVRKWLEDNVDTIAGLVDKAPQALSWVQRFLP